MPLPRGSRLLDGLPAADVEHLARFAKVVSLSHRVRRRHRDRDQLLAATYECYEISRVAIETAPAETGEG
jgi:hypothetical protein